MTITVVQTSSTGVLSSAPGTFIDLVNPTTPLLDSTSNISRAAIFLLAGFLLGR